MSNNGDLDIVRKKAESQGFRYDKTTNGHHRFYAPNKEDIVVTSGTPGDQRSWNNFMSDMRRAGYKDEPGPIGIALIKAKAVEEAPVNTTPPVENLTTVEWVRRFLRENPNNVFNTDRIAIHVLGKKPDSNKLAVQQALTSMAARSEIRRVSRGEYQWGTPITPQLVSQNTAASTPAAPTAAMGAPLHGIGAVMGQFTGDATIDVDLAILDEALVALGQIEEVVSRNRERLFALAQFKKLLGG